MRDVIGWASSLVLVLSIAKQVQTQWSERTSRGVSIWLYIGEMSAEAGFVIYSWQLRNGVFVVTNILLFILSMVGLWIVLLHRGKLS